MASVRQRGKLAEQMLHQLLEQVLPLKSGPDPELALEALLDATQQLREHLEQELAEIRLEQVE